MRVARDYERRRRTVLQIIVILFTGVFVLMYSAGDIADDYQYRCEFAYDYSNPIEFDYCQGEVIDDFEGVAESFWNHYHYWGNGRLGTFLMFASNLLSRNIENLLQALAVVAFMLMIAKLSVRGWRSRPLETSVVFVAIWIVLPWYDFMLASSFLYNYVWGALLNLVFIMMIGNIEERRERWHTVAIVIIGIVAGWMHEGMSVAVSVALMVSLWFDFKKEWRCDGLKAIAVAAYLGGAALAVFSPAVWNRVDYTLPGVAMPAMKYLVYNVGVQCYPFSLFVLMILYRGVRHGRSRVGTYLRENLVLVVSGSVGIIIAVAMQGYIRVMWFAFVTFLILDIKMLMYERRRLRFGVQTECVLAFVIVMVLSIWMLAIARQQQKYERNKAACEQKMRDSSTNLVYHDIPLEGSSPWWMFEIPKSITSHHWNVYVSAYGRSGRKVEFDFMPILPERHAGVPFDSLPTIAGNSGLRGEFPYYYSPHRLPPDCRMMFEFGDPSDDGTVGSVNPIYGIGRSVSKLLGGDGCVHAPLGFDEMPVKVSDEMREEGICDSDTAWFYRVRRIGRSLYGCKVLSIDIIRQE